MKMSKPPIVDLSTNEYVCGNCQDTGTIVIGVAHGLPVHEVCDSPMHMFHALEYGQAQTKFVTRLITQRMSDAERDAHYRAIVRKYQNPEDERINRLIDEAFKTEDEK